MIVAKIDVKKIVKSRLFVGAKGTYLDISLVENRDGTDQYGNDGFVSQSVSKEAREAGEKGAIIGNWRRVGETKKPAQKPPVDPEDDDIQF